MRISTAFIVIAAAALLLASACGDGGQPVTTGATGKIAFRSDRDGNHEVYVMNTDGSGVTRLTDDTADDGDPAWSRVP